VVPVGLDPDGFDFYRNNVAMERGLLQARTAIRNRYPGCSGCVYNKVGIDS
jgi:hypothetical protein